MKLARRQHGVVASRQLQALGIRRNEIARGVRRGRLIRLHRGVYAVGHDRLTARGRWMAAVLAGGDGAVLSHRAALALWDLASGSSRVIDVTARRDHRIDGVRCHRARRLHPDDHTIIDGIPVTSLARTLLDLAQTLHLQRLRTLLEQAQHRGLFNSLSFEALLERSAGHHGARPLKAVLGQLTDEAPWTQSALERRFLEFVRTHGLPEPQTNVIVDGVCVDCYWPVHDLIAELDGYASHSPRSVFESDRGKGLVHARNRRQVIHITQRMITRDGPALRANLSVLLELVS